MIPDRLEQIAAATNALKEIRERLVDLSSDLDVLHDEEVEAEQAGDDEDQYSCEAEDALLHAYELIGVDFDDALGQAIVRLEALVKPAGQAQLDLASELFDWEDA